MERIKRCVHCGSKPQIEQDENEFIIECCGNNSISPSEGELINYWNNYVNQIWHYVVGIIYDVDENEQAYRDLDFMAEYTNDDIENGRAIKFLENHKNLFHVETRKNKFEGIPKSFHESYMKFEAAQKVVELRAPQQHNLKKVCHFTSSFKITREDMTIMIKYMDKEKLENAAIKKFA